MKKSNINFLYIVIGLLFSIIILKDKDLDIKIFTIKDDEELEEPKRYYDSKYTTRNRMRINVPTRGEPPPYQQVGILTDTDNPENIKPLYGRQTYRGSNLWNYYTALDSHLSTKIPIETNRNCTETHGCSEINSGDNINIINSTDEYKVNLYPYNDLQYIPYL